MYLYMLQIITIWVRYVTYNIKYVCCRVCVYMFCVRIDHYVYKSGNVSFVVSNVISQFATVQYNCSMVKRIVIVNYFTYVNQTSLPMR